MTKQLHLLIPVLALFVFCGSPFAQEELEYKTFAIGNSKLNFGDALLNDDQTLMVAGWSKVNGSGKNKLAPYGRNDIWLVKLKNYGVEWKRSFGGKGDETNVRLLKCTDGNILLACSSDSDISGNKEKDSYGKSDFWLMKLDQEGQIIWQQNYGSFENDYISSILETDNNHFLLCGNTEGPSSGLRSNICSAKGDVWMVCIDSSGTLKWENTIKNNASNTLKDAAVDDFDNTYLLSGSVNEFQNDNNTASPSQLTLTKVNSKGETIWSEKSGQVQKGNNARILTSGNAVYLAFTSIDPKNQTSQQFTDYRLIKYDSNGNQIWDKNFGGTKNEVLVNGLLTSNHKILLIGQSNSPRSGQKSENARSENDYWVIALDTNGTAQWNKTITNKEHTTLNTIGEVSKESYLCTGISETGISVVKIVHRRI